MNADRLLAESKNDAPGTALFRDAEAAVRFALQNRSRSPGVDTLAALRGPAGRSGSLSRSEIPAQAGMILAAINGMSEFDMALLILKLGPKARPCDCRRSCCRGWATDAMWDAARLLMVERTVEALSGHITNYRMRDGLIRLWTGEKVDVGRLADLCSVHRNTVTSHARLIRDWLQPRYKRALATADAMMRGAGDVVLESAPLQVAEQAS